MHPGACRSAPQPTNQGTQLWDIGVWDESDPILYGGNVDAADVDFDHAVDLPATWNGGLVTLGFNPVKVVEDRLAQYVSNGGTAADFLRTDDVFEVDVSVNLVGVCENTSSYGVKTYHGYTRRPVTVAIFYKGDPKIEDEITSIDGPPAASPSSPRCPPSST